VGGHPIGLDISFLYSAVYQASGETAITGSATELPFTDNIFDSVWTIGVLHHLPDPEARLMILEMHRVCRPGGYIAVFDAVLPCSPWRRPLAYLVRKLDRGKFMRTQSELEALLPDRLPWTVNRFTYAINGLEMLLCWNKKTA
jgi:ubiquinone/menaquinone biosynthesis C-methylase UbiE